MRAYKFLRPGAVGPFSGVHWPVPDDAAPGDWIRAESTDPALCRSAVHACAPDQLPFWLGEELWEIELETPVAQQRSKLVAPAGRLVARVTAWDEAAARAFCAATVDRIRRMDTGGYMTEVNVFCVGDAAAEDPFGSAALSTMIAVEAAEHTGGVAAVRRERADEAAWLAERLGLAATGY